MPEPESPQARAKREIGLEPDDPHVRAKRSPASPSEARDRAHVKQQSGLQPQSQPTEVLPSKLYYRIGEVADLVGVEPHVLRYWEREFRTIRPTKSTKGQRVYSRRDVESLHRVRELLYSEGFTIAGARKKLQETGAPCPSPTELPPQARATLQALRAEMAQFLEELPGPHVVAKRGGGPQT